MEKKWKARWVVCVDPGAVPMTAEIGRARRHEEMPDVWFCPVSMPSIFENEKQIAGVDGEQAFELSLQFVKTMFENKGADIGSFEIRPVGNDDPEL